MVEPGQIAMKLAGRDSGNICVIIEVIDPNYVLIDGNVRRKKCNIKHLEFLDKVIKIKKNTSTEEIKKELEKLGIKIKPSGKRRESKPRPRQKRKEIKTEKPSKNKGGKVIKEK
ncbi:MAG: 50S ribosomal protein L14e [Nanoarchaeota archaeon]